MSTFNSEQNFQFLDQPSLSNKAAQYLQSGSSFSFTNHEWHASAPEADDVDPLADIGEELEENEIGLEDC